MGSWYDFIPGAQTAIDGVDSFVHGNNPWGRAAKENKQGFYEAVDADHALANHQRALAMQGLDKAEGFYAPARKRLNAAYGEPGTATI